VTKSAELALMLYTKWQKDAEAMNGPKARIAVNNAAATKIIVDYLTGDSLPMNISQINKVCTFYTSMHLYPASWTLVSPQASICNSSF
jgi:hypothetical protein